MFMHTYHLPGPALPCPALPCPDLTCPALPCPALPCFRDWCCSADMLLLCCLKCCISLSQATKQQYVHSAAFPIQLQLETQYPNSVSCICRALFQRKVVASTSLSMLAAYYVLKLLPSSASCVAYNKKRARPLSCLGLVFELELHCGLA